MKSALAGVSKLIVVEENATAQLAQLVDRYGIRVDDKILRFDGRPFTPDELRSRIEEVIA
jgi:2-oxoglutarate ferredoxin oxidoreductase subunit alpha